MSVNNARDDQAAETVEILQIFTCHLAGKLGYKVIKWIMGLPQLEYIKYSWQV